MGGRGLAVFARRRRPRPVGPVSPRASPPATSLRAGVPPGAPGAGRSPARALARAPAHGRGPRAACHRRPGPPRPPLAHPVGLGAACAPARGGPAALPFGRPPHPAPGAGRAHPPHPPPPPPALPPPPPPPPLPLPPSEARRLGHNFVGTEQILLGLIGESTGIAAKVLKSMGVNLKDARVEVEKVIGRGSGFVAVEIPFTPRAKRVLELSLEEARQLGHNYIGTEHILLGLMREGEGVAARVLETLGADAAKIRTQVIRMVGESQEAVGAGVGGASGGNKMPTLEEYGTNLTNQAVEGKLDPCVGRAKEIERVTQILGRRTKNNPCLIGEPGVGKTAVAEGLAQRIAGGDVPETIEGKQVVTLDMGLLVAGTKYRGEFEERLKKLMDEIKQVGARAGAGGRRGPRARARRPPPMHPPPLPPPPRPPRTTTSSS